MKYIVALTAVTLIIAGTALTVSGFLIGNVLIMSGSGIVGYLAAMAD